MRRAEAALAAVRRAQLRGGAWSEGAREIAEERAIAFIVDGGAEAVMMATPADLEDFAYGFALTDGLAGAADDIGELEIAENELGIEVRMWLRDGAGAAHAARRRWRAGPAGCGLCGVESLADAMRPVAVVDASLRLSAHEITAAMAELASLQPLNQATRAVHAAALYVPGAGVQLVREDVGRHNALDKLAGALFRQGRDARDGAILMTSRVSIELVQKAARIGAPVLAAVSAPTSLALRAADAAGICVCGVVRADGLEVFTRPDRIIQAGVGHGQ